MVLRQLCSMGIVAILVAGCGKYGPPVPPEALGPAAVGDIAVTTDATSVSLSWKSPKSDIRSKELRSIDGYNVIRATLEGSGSPQFAPLAFIEDSHIRERDRLREEARAAGKPARRVDVPPSLTAFTYVDKTVTAGGRYMYRIVPVNQGGVLGATRESIRITFNGTASEIARVSAADLESELFDDSLTGGEL